MVNALLVLLLVLLSSRFWAQNEGLPQAQYNALYDLYNATHGSDWSWNEDTMSYGYPWAFVPGANPCTDRWQGIICNNDSNSYDVAGVSLPQYNLVGSIPESFGDLVHLTFFLFSDNKLTGTLPDSLANLTQLTYAALDDNMLNGTIPSYIGRWTQVSSLDLSNNLFRGTVPSTIGLLSQMEFLTLSYNALTGSIPTTIGNLTQMTQFAADHNLFDGPIPPTLGNCLQLREVELTYNQLTGPIPTSLCQLSNLNKLSLQINYLTSTIPECIGNLSRLFVLQLGDNELHGHIPQGVNSLLSLNEFSAFANQLTGPIPDMTDFYDLTYLVLLRNRLTGTIPAGVWKVVYVYLDNNDLQGTLPDFATTYHGVDHLNISTNHIHGTIPSTINLLHNLVVLAMSDNLLTGTVPSALGALPLAVLQLGDNMLRGPIAPFVFPLTDLVVLGLQRNRFTGSLDNVFRKEQNGLITLQLDDNQFTGELPRVLFDLQSLISLSIVGSCLTGTLPSNICNATTLEALVLYGLTTGESCRAIGNQALSLTHSMIGGDFPECVLALPKLRTLLLASNSLKGKMGDSWRVSESLLQLDLSHNLLTGTVSMSIQNHSWSLLDLSHNKLGGVLDSQFFPKHNFTTDHQSTTISTVSETLVRANFTLFGSAESVLSLDTNRLSGRIPNNIKPLRDVAVLAGNLFQCEYDKRDLPQHDSDVTDYECASNAFDLSIYVWVALMLIGVTIVLLRAKSLASTCSSQYLVTDEKLHECLAKVPSGAQVFRAFSVVAKTALYCTAFCMFVLLPYYVIISQFQGTHTHQYAYVLSAIYTSGAVPFALNTVLWFALCVLMLVMCRVASSLHIVAIPSRTSLSLERAYVWTIFTAVNVSVVMGVNIVFVYTVLYQSTAAQTAAQVLLSLFKLGWSTAVSPWMIRQLDNYFIPTSEGPAEPFFTLQLLVALFNNIAIPCLVVMAVDPNCFNDIILSTESETVNYLLPVCVENLQQSLHCQNIYFVRSSLTFTPPFTYSYQCSASFITSYAPTFVYMSIATVFVNPISRYTMMYWHARFTPTSRAHRVTSALLPRVLQPPPATSAQPSVKKVRPLFRAVGILVTLLMQLGVLLTFGAIFPPVALAMAVSIVATVYTARWELCRFVQSVEDSQCLHCYEMLHAECIGVGTREQKLLAGKIIVCYCCLFYNLFLFDTLGDKQGFAATVWVLFVVPLAPVVTFMSWGAVQKYQRKDMPIGETQKEEVELKEVGTSGEVDPTVNVLHASDA